MSASFYRPLGLVYALIITTAVFPADGRTVHPVTERLLEELGEEASLEDIPQSCLRSPEREPYSIKRSTLHVSPHGPVDAKHRLVRELQEACIFLPSYAEKIVQHIDANNRDEALEQIKTLHLYLAKMFRDYLSGTCKYDKWSKVLYAVRATNTSEGLERLGLNDLQIKAITSWLNCNPAFSLSFQLYHALASTTADGTTTGDHTLTIEPAQQDLTEGDEHEHIKAAAEWLAENPDFRA